MIWHDGDYICLECAMSDSDVQICEWCNEQQLGGLSLDDSYINGFCVCPGKGLPD